jgi:hypothetical protein
LNEVVVFVVSYFGCWGKQLFEKCWLFQLLGTTTDWEIVPTFFRLFLNCCHYKPLEKNNTACAAIKTALNF